MTDLEELKIWVAEEESLAHELLSPICDRKEGV